jgi:Fe/S biogenesis protein NfuA
MSTTAEPTPELGTTIAGDLAGHAPDDLVITVTEPARVKLVELRDAEPEGDRLGVRIEIVADTGPEFTYDMSFQVITKSELTDVVRSHGGLRVIIPAKDTVHLEGAVLDYELDGFVLRNPNRPRPVSLGNLITGDALSAEVEAVIAADVNPSLAAHGGFVTYVGHDGEGHAYLTMGGGCHGCAMSRMTMLQGVQTMIKDAVPGIERVIDATDHSTGENPYYAR